MRTRVADIGARTITVARPRVFFSDDGTMPERAELRFVVPEAVLEACGLEELRARIAAAVEKKAKKARAEVEAAGWPFKGADRVRKSSPYARAKTFEERHQLNPRYASAGDTEALNAAIACDAEFVVQYALARERWLAGERDVVWPPGTYAMRRWHPVRCAESRLRAPGATRSGQRSPSRRAGTPGQVVVREEHRQRLGRALTAVTRHV